MDLILLDVSDNRATDASLRTLLQRLQQKQREGGSLLELRLSRNRLGRQSFQHVAGLLKVKGSTLVKLSLEETGLNDPSVAVVAQALQSSKQPLTHLNLAKNRIGDAGAGSVARALAVNQKVRGRRWSSILVGFPPPTLPTPPQASPARSVLEQCRVARWSGPGACPCWKVPDLTPRPQVSVNPKTRDLNENRR